MPLEEFDLPAIRKLLEEVLEAREKNKKKARTMRNLLKLMNERIKGWGTWKTILFAVFVVLLAHPLLVVWDPFDWVKKYVHKRSGTEQATGQTGNLEGKSYFPSTTKKGI